MVGDPKGHHDERHQHPRARRACAFSACRFASSATRSRVAPHLLLTIHRQPPSRPSQGATTEERYVRADRRAGPAGVRRGVRRVRRHRLYPPQRVLASSMATPSPARTFDSGLVSKDQGPVPQPKAGKAAPPAATGDDQGVGHGPPAVATPSILTDAVLFIAPCSRRSRPTRVAARVHRRLAGRRGCRSARHSERSTFSYRDRIEAITVAEFFDPIRQATVERSAASRSTSPRTRRTPVARGSTRARLSSRHLRLARPRLYTVAPRPSAPRCG